MFDKFLDWRWKELVNLNETRSPKKPGCKDDQQKQAALRLVRCGELSRAARVLTSVGLAPTCEETVQKLERKHPARSEEIIMSHHQQILLQ